ncbi:unnamed protein product [Prunus armeniaca]
MILRSRESKKLLTRLCRRWVLLNLIPQLHKTQKGSDPREPLFCSVSLKGMLGICVSFSLRGEVALPGGKREEGDKDDGDTATREAKEEIGLDPSLVNVVTVLEPFLSKHLLRVVPVIGILNEKEAFKAAPNPAEVEAVFDAPLEMFIKDENRRSEEREWMGNKYLIHFFDYEAKNKKYIIWGLTAGILIRAASIVYKRSPPFVEQNPIYKVPRVVDINTTIP